MALKAGEIVFAFIPDPDGNPCRDEHPVMIFRTAPGSAEVWVVGITSAFTEPIPQHWIRLPFASGGHHVTGLWLDSVLKCNWISRKPIAALSAPIGVVPADLFELATDVIATRAEQQRPKQGPSPTS